MQSQWRTLTKPPEDHFCHVLADVESFTTAGGEEGHTVRVGTPRDLAKYPQDTLVFVRLKSIILSNCCQKRVRRRSESVHDRK